MASYQQRFDIFRKTDGQVAAVLDGIPEPVKISKKSFSSPAGSLDDDVLKRVLEIDTVEIQHFSYSLANGATVQVRRNNAPDQNPPSQLDTVVVDCGGAKVDIPAHAALMKYLRNGLGAVDQRVRADLLAESDKQYYALREESLNRLELMQQKFFSQFEEWSVARLNEFDERRKALDFEFKARSDGLESESRKRVEELQLRERDLDDRTKAVDARKSTYVRREKQDKFLDKLAKREFALKPGTHIRQWVVIGVYTIFIVYLVVNAQSGALESEAILRRSDSIGVGAVWAPLVRSTVCAVSAILAFGFFLRWLNRWQQRFTDEEFRLKRLELDFQRAAWVIEMGISWEEETNHIAPQMVLDRLSRNLFGEQSSEDSGMTAGDALAHAIMQSSAKVETEIGGTRFSLNRAGLKQLDETKVRPHIEGEP